MSDNSQIQLLIGFGVLLLFATAYGIGRRRSLFGAGPPRGLPLSLTELTLVLVSLTFVLVLIGGLNPAVAGLVVLGLLAAWVARRRFASYPTTTTRTERLQTQDERSLRVTVVKGLVMVYILAGSIVGGLGYFLLTQGGMPPETARAYITVILVGMGVWIGSVCLSEWRGER